MDAYALLSAEDRAYAKTTGVKCENAPELHTTDSSGKLVLSVKGLQFIKYACQEHGLPFIPSSLETQKDLIRLAIEMSRIRMNRLQSSTAQRLRAGTLPAQERDFAQAVLQGDVSDALDAAQRHDDCAQAGPNVVPLGGTRGSRPPG